MDDMGMSYQLRGIEGPGHTWEYGALTFDEMQGLNTSFLNASIALYSNWRNFGSLPHGQGTLAERQCVLDILRILKAEECLFDSWEREKTSN